MPGTRRRADATENRARIIEVAREVAGGSDELRLNAVAKAAGVGQGTLYRHFPTRESLLLEVYRHEVDALCDAVPRLLARHPPLEALDRWFDQLADYARVKRGVFDAVEAASRTEVLAHSHTRLDEAVTLLLDAGRDDGTIRDDVDARDVILLVGYLSRLDERERATRARHLLDIVLAGLQAP